MNTIKIGALAGALVIAAAAPGWSAPIIGGAALTQSVPQHVTDVRWRGRGIGPGLAFGLAAGALAGAAVAARPYGYYDYGPGYDYGEPVYADPYAGGPVYAAPGYYRGYGYGGCYTDEGYGRTRPCDAR